jgi:hypothetical protein
VSDGDKGGEAHEPSYLRMRIKINTRRKGESRGAAEEQGPAAR